MKINSLLVASVMIIVLSACAPKFENRPIIEQENLLVKCSYETPVPTNFILDKNGARVYTGSEMMRVLTSWQEIYNDCATVHDSLVDTINKLGNLKTIPKD